MAIRAGDHPLDTPFDRDESFFINEADVLSVDPNFPIFMLLLDDLILFRIVQVAQKNGWAGHTDLAVCVVW